MDGSELTAPTVSSDGGRRVDQPGNSSSRVVIFAYGHPDYSAGGSEMAAYSQFVAMSATNPEAVNLVCWIEADRAVVHGGGAISRLSPGTNEWLYHAPHTEWLFQSSADRYAAAELVDFVLSLKPDILHFHHYLGFGLDVLRLLKARAPRLKIVFTLHEYLAICARDGQMVTSGDSRLCHSASPVRCNGCFPHLARAELALRETWFKRHFALVDLFLAPSAFLRQRYIDWGIEPARIRIIENAQICTVARDEKIAEDQDRQRVFAYFGQITPYKGADILFSAAQAIADLAARQNDTPRLKILVYGSFRRQSPEFQSQLLEKFDALDGLIEYRGSYDRAEVISLMRTCGWIIVPSTWWENSPVVIEEAFHAGRPVICADIGGMREKVADGVNGVHFRARDPQHLAAVIRSCASDPELWPRLAANVRTLPSLADSALQLYAAYAQVSA